MLHLFFQYTFINTIEVIQYMKDIKVNGNIEVTYKIVNKKDLNLTLGLEDLLKNEKVLKVIKSEFAKGYRNIDVKVGNELSDNFILETQNSHYSFTVLKDDFADILALAEDDATTKKLLKKDCFVELVDIKTVE